MALQRANKQKKLAEEAYLRFLNAIDQDAGKSTIMSDALSAYGERAFGKTKFRGVYPRDQIPSLKRGQGCIVNNKNHDEEGEHWVALARGRDSGLLLQYDSFGRNDFLKLGEQSKDAEHDAEQADEEENCGNRCLAFLAVFYTLGENFAVWI